MPQAAVQPVGALGVGKDLLAELERAYDAFVGAIGEIQELLGHAPPDLSRLTTIRLKLARLRLARGPLITQVSSYLSGKITPSEELILKQLQSTHQLVLEHAMVHTGTWTVPAIEANWPEYRRATRELAQRWLAKAKVEQHLIQPLLRRNV